MMAAAGQPTSRTRHISIREFAIQSWVEQDMIQLQHISTHINSSDVQTKSTAKILFHRHNDILMGKMQPSYLYKIKKCFQYPLFPFSGLVPFPLRITSDKDTLLGPSKCGGVSEVETIGMYVCT